MPGSVLGGSETDIKDLEGVNRFRGESQAMATSYNMHQGKGGYGKQRKFTWILIGLAGFPEEQLLG